MFLKYMLFLVLTLPWFAGGKKPKPTQDTFTNENKLTIQENSGCKGQILHPDCSGRVILLDASSGSGLAGKGQGANTGGCVFKDGDETSNFDIPDWILRDCNLKGSCDIPADAILNLYANMEYVEIKYFCIDRKPVYDMCAPVTIQETSAYLISYGYPSMPLINDITDECECAGTLQKKTLFAYRLLDGDLRSRSPGQRDCDPAQSLEISSKGSSKTFTCANQNADRDFKTIYPKGGNDYAEILFENELKQAGGRFILEYKHGSGSFELTCNPERVMPPTRPTTTTTTTQSTTTTTTPTTAMTTTPSPTTTTPSPSSTTTTTTPTTTTITSTTTTLAATTSIKTTTTEATTITPDSSITKPLIPKTTQQKEATRTTGGSPEPTPTITASQQPASPFVDKDATTLEPTAKILNSKAQSKDTNLGMIIGIASAVVVLAIVAIILFIFIRRRNRKSKLDRKMSEVDLVETEPPSDVYCNPAATLQTRFNTNSVENDYNDASPAAETGRCNADSEYSNYSSVNPMYGLNIDSGEDYSVIENRHIRIKESGSFGTESKSDTCGTNVPVYAVVNKNKKQAVPVHDRVNEDNKEKKPIANFESRVKGGTGEVRGKVDEGGSYSFENQMIGNESVPDQGFVNPGLSDKMTDPVAEDVYHMVDDEAPDMTYSLEEGVPSVYALEEPVGQGANEYLDILPDPVDVPSQGTGVHAGEFTQQKLGNGQTGFAFWNPVRPSNAEQFNGNLGPTGQQPAISKNTNADGGETDGEYVYTYSHFPKNTAQNGQGSATSGYIGRPVISEPGSVSHGSLSPPGTAGQPGTEPEYALYDAGDTYACIEGSHTEEGEAGENGASLSHGQGLPSPGSDPTYFLYDEGGGVEGGDEEEYHYIPTEGPRGAGEQEDDIYHEL